MKFLSKICLTISLLLSLSFLFPSSIYAFTCDKPAIDPAIDGVAITIYVKVSSKEAEKIDADKFELEYQGTIISESASVIIPVYKDGEIIGYTLTFIVSDSTIAAEEIDKNTDGVSFRVDHPDDDDCRFSLQDTDIAAAITGPPTASGGGGSGSTSTSNCHTSYGDGTLTGLGCIPSSPEDLVKWLLVSSLGIGGGIAILLSFWGGISIILAGGDPEKINQAKQTITAAVTGLLVIAFSVFLLRFIGVDVLQLPGFQK